MPTALCPNCGVYLECHHHVSGPPGGSQSPLVGAFTGCVECGAISIWEHSIIGLNLRKLTPDEAREIAKTPDFAHFYRKLQAARFRRRGEDTA